MTQITEDYVSYEIAKLLKEKGFDGRCHMSIGKYKQEEVLAKGTEWDDSFILCPTLQMAMKWLREEHDICIYCYPSSLEKYGKWESGACWIKDNVSVIFNNCSHSLYAESYEEAVEAALNYVLKNLI